MKSHRETIFERALDCVSRGAERDLFYAAFELRCGKEARQQYLETWEHVSKSQRRLENCQSGASVEAKFRIGHRNMRWEMRHHGSDKPVAVLYFRHG
jgi:hypothetical protein